MQGMGNIHTKYLYFLSPSQLLSASTGKPERYHRFIITFIAYVITKAYFKVILFSTLCIP